MSHHDNPVYVAEFEQGDTISVQLENGIELAGTIEYAQFEVRFGPFILTGDTVEVLGGGLVGTVDTYRHDDKTHSAVTLTFDDENGHEVTVAFTPDEIPQATEPEYLCHKHLKIVSGDLVHDPINPDVTVNLGAVDIDISRFNVLPSQRPPSTSA